MFIKTYSSDAGVQFVVIDPENLNLRCKVDRFGQLSCTLDEPSSEWQSQVYTDEMQENDYVKVALELIGKYADNILPICRKLDLHIEGEGIVRCRNFKHLVDRVDHYEVLDLSNLGIDCLPFQVGFFDVEQLNLSGNNLGFLPPSLKCLENLRVINLRGNPIARGELPEWFNSWIQDKAIEIFGVPQFNSEDNAQDENRRPEFVNGRPFKRNKTDPDETQNDLAEYY